MKTGKMRKAGGHHAEEQSHLERPKEAVPSFLPVRSEQLTTDTDIIGNQLARG